jgi:hypothetical protein
VFPARYELNSYIVFRKRLVSKRLSGSMSFLHIASSYFLFVAMTSCLSTLSALNDFPRDKRSEYDSIPGFAVLNKFPYNSIIIAADIVCK